ncbi:MAG: carboxypeptidase-like regulatory domain-containing protein [bacterium]
MRNVRRILWVGLALAGLGFASCSSGGGDDEAESQAVTVVFGRLTAGGQPVAGARVQGGGATATTDADGRYQLKAATSLGITVRFEAEGYLPAVRSTPVLDQRPTALDATLVAEAPAQPLDAAAGGTISGARGAQVTVPPGGLVLAVGGSVEGMVDVHLTPLDPTKPDELTAGTDAFAGRDETGRVTLLGHGAWST